MRRLAPGEFFVIRQRHFVAYNHSPVSILDQILGPGGAIARRMGDRYEHRPQQLEMAHAVERAIERQEHLLVEAGTGVGKSFAYLLPVINYAVTQNKRIVISTHTISLQEQLIDKDIPLIRSVYPDEFTAVLVKGRGNYLCQRRLEQTKSRSRNLFEREDEQESLWTIDRWSQTTTDGSLSDLPTLPVQGVWERVNAEQGNCLGKRCKFYDGCFWQSAKRRMTSGSILIVNHALFFSDLALRMAGVQYLPKYDLVVLDEAHTAEDVAGDHFGLRLSEASVRYNLHMLYDAQKHKGLLLAYESIAQDAIELTKELEDVAEDFFGRIADWHDANGRQNGRVQEADVVRNTLSKKLRDLSKQLRVMLPKIESEEDVSEVTSFANKIKAMADSAEAILSQSLEDTVYWFDLGRRSPRRVSIHAAPINVGEGLRKHLFEAVKPVILTSATLCTAASARAGVRSVPRAVELDAEDSQLDVPTTAQSGAAEKSDPAFAYVRSRLGIHDGRSLQLDSPFDYGSQATLFIESGMPDPSDTARFEERACPRILKYLDITRGGAFVLFTSYAMMNKCAQTLEADIESRGMTLLVQGKGTNRSAMLDQFRQTENAVLFGTSSFWQGIDVQGEALRNVIIVKLPFDVPDEPIIEARLDSIKRAGGNPFMEYSVPQAVIRLKQGFGRLIRSKSDTGIVVILDPRVKTKRYGRMFLESLPKCRVVEVKH
jgi:ATP-dependent DNA helicase DinG